MTFQQMGQLIIETGMLLAQHLDQYLASKGVVLPNGRDLHDILEQSHCHKGRLLHYRPPQAASTSSRWCGVHRDHGTVCDNGLLGCLRASCMMSTHCKAAGLDSSDIACMHTHILQVGCGCLASSQFPETFDESAAFLELTGHEGSVSKVRAWTTTICATAAHHV